LILLKLFDVERTTLFKRPIINLIGEQESNLDLIDILIRVLMGLFLWLTVGTVSTVPDEGGKGDMPANGETFQSFTNIESVDVLVMESFPMQVSLVVKGAQPDGCEFPVIVEQQREGNTVTVQIYRDMPLAVMCAAVLIPYEATIPLEGGFEPGSYTFSINDFVIEKTL
jgi:inhibitor of cysteine peptidase